MNILAVDDETDTRLFLRDLLTQVGHHVATAASAEEAVAALERDPVDVVLLDLMMPGTDGFELGRSLARSWTTKDLPVIVISCLRDEESKSCARIFGCTRYLEKPFDPGELIEALQDIDRGRREPAPI